MEVSAPGFGELNTLARPRPLPARPELLQLLLVALRVHAGPEAAVPVHAQLSSVGEPQQRLALERAGLVGVQIREELAAEKEISAADPLVVEIGLLAELLDLRTVHAQLTIARRGVHAEHGPDAPLAHMERELLRE